MFLCQVDHVNINFATEEELMTLPGVNRECARAIVSYRARLGGFRQAEDLVLVPGIGGDRLASLLQEITVDGDCADTNSLASIAINSRSSQGQSGDQSLPRCASFTTNVSTASAPVVKPVPLNTANVFQLMKVPGLTQKQAEAIVTYRFGIFQSCL